MPFKRRAEKRKLKAERETRRNQLLRQLNELEKGRAIHNVSFYLLTEEDAEKLSPDQRRRYNEAIHKLFEQQRFTSKVNTLQNLYASAQAATSSDAAIEAWLDVWKELDRAPRELDRSLEEFETAVGISRQDAHDKLQQAVTERYDELMSQRQNARQFRQLRELIIRTRGDSNQSWFQDLLQAGIKPLQRPKDWNDLIAQFFRTPDHSFFDGVPEHLDPAEVRLLAATAIREDNLTKAQIALSFCNENWYDSRYYLKALGAVRLAELASLVERKLAELHQNATPNQV